jgi:large subunit ribosomal protein L22
MNMQVKATQKFVKTTPRKLRLVADSVRRMHPTAALTELKFMPKRAAEILSKVIRQAITNAVNNEKLNEKDLRFEHILIEEGPRYRRFRAASRGRARMIQKRTSHIRVVITAAQPKHSPAKAVPAKAETLKKAIKKSAPKAEPKNTKEL